MIVFKESNTRRQFNLKGSLFTNYHPSHRLLPAKWYKIFRNPNLNSTPLKITGNMATDTYMISSAFLSWWLFCLQSFGLFYFIIIIFISGGKQKGYINTYDKPAVAMKSCTLCGRISITHNTGREKRQKSHCAVLSTMFKSTSVH